MTEHGVSWRDYVDRRFEDSGKAVDAALAASEKAVIKAETAADKRFDAVNEFRAALADQAAQLMPRSEWLLESVALREKISALENWRSRATGAAVVLSMLAGLAGAALMKVFGG